MSTKADLIDSVIQDAVEQLRNATQAIVTVALYFDHESSALSVCADTEKNSARSVAQANAFSLPYFEKAIEAGDLEGAALWQGNIGRSLSLGDFTHVNLARRDVPPGLVDEAWFASMAQGLMRHAGLVLQVCASDAVVVFAVSTATDEVGLVWCPKRDG